MAMAADGNGIADARLKLPPYLIVRVSEGENGNYLVCEKVHGCWGFALLWERGGLTCDFAEETREK